MRRINLGWLASVSALAALMVIGQPVLARQNEEPVKITSFSGAYLAARVAEVDNDLDSAIAYYKRALAFDTENQQLQQSLMLALISQGRFDESLPYAEKLKSVAEIERFSRVALAIDTIRKKDYPAAEHLLKLAAESDLDRLISSVMTAWAKLGAGDGKAALAYLEKLSGPEWYTLFTTYHSALIADVAGQTDVADQLYSETIDNVAAGSAAPETWLRAAEAYARFLAMQGEEDKALAILDKADEFASGRLALAALREKISKDETISPLISNPADGSSEILLDLASALSRGGGEPFVRIYLQFALALKPDSDAVLLQLASVAEQQENAEEAIALYQRVPADSPLKRASELQLGLNLADLDRHDEAVEHLKRLLDQDPDDVRAYLALGGVYSSKEEYRNAADVYDRAAERLKEPTRAEWNIFYQRGIAYERLKEWPKAEPNFRKALELMPDQPQVLNYLGYSWVDMNMNLDEGLDMIRKAVELRPSDGYIVDSLGWAYYRLGRFEEAVTELERAVSLKPDDPVLNDHLGDAYWRVGRKLEATFQWSHARDMKPEPDVLANVQKKLAEGLPPIEGKAAAEAPSKPVAPEVKPAPAPDPDKKSELIAPAPAGKVAVTPAAYKVQRGQSLWSIADEVLGNGGRYQEILNLNPQLQGDPGRIVPGQELILPALSD
ncbi:tetratricopeptide repeat protein [Pseudaminobacter sp. NGMCC 1.201702]|uniref:tetratricopeptide repeat protein n=1 Tax=Pseudaminobacter sp. NGMCC 1.201702 TaxID=3391825 RepID=UPI0039EDEEC8